MVGVLAINSGVSLRSSNALRNGGHFNILKVEFVVDDIKDIV